MHGGSSVVFGIGLVSLPGARTIRGCLQSSALLPWNVVWPRHVQVWIIHLLYAPSSVIGSCLFYIFCCCLLYSRRWLTIPFQQAEPGDSSRRPGEPRNRYRVPRVRSDSEGRTQREQVICWSNRQAHTVIRNVIPNGGSSQELHMI